MSSQDVLERLFEVERKAEELVAEARAEADRRVVAAKESIERERGLRNEAALTEARQVREAAEKAADAEYRSALDSYRKLLAAAALDEAAFKEACERGLTGAT